MNKVHRLTITMATAAVLVTGCVHPNGEANNTATGALVGAGGGAAFGAALGAVGGGGRGAAAGALIGGAIGAITGTLIGHQIDQEQAAELREQYPVTYAHVEQQQPLTVADVEALTQAKVSDDVIIVQIQNTRSVYHLTSTDIINLHSAGVSDRVINFMIKTVNLPPPTPPAPTVVETTVG
ncbi:MAG TPA: glycine zipper domain-containing protein, partial [Candidatus Acidoferrum sp.]|nr:glycine zipper domain-containing protein [Candidatus Acidoferrum sp.]